VGEIDCATSVQFTGNNQNKIVLAGQHLYNDHLNIALARFETTPDGSGPPPPPPPPGPRQIYLPAVLR
jgi:hypothetical protein